MKTILFGALVALAGTGALADGNLLPSACEKGGVMSFDIPRDAGENSCFYQIVEE